jgi:hypothetical protein
LKTKKIGIGFLILTLFMTTIFYSAMGNKIDENNISKVFYGDELDQYQEIYHDYLYYIYLNETIAQSFKPSLNTLTRVELLMFEWNDVNYELTVSIKKNLNGLPLTKISLTPNGFLDDEEWVEFDFEDINVVPGDTYYIICSGNGGSIGDRDYETLVYGWGLSRDGSSYTDGEVWLNWIGNDFLWEIDDRDYDCCFRTYGFSNEPPLLPTIDGPSNGIPNEEYLYQISSSDPNTDDVCFYIDWGDNNTEETDYFNSGELITVKHQWTERGNYTLKVKAIDEYGTESDWAILEISMPKKRIFNFIPRILVWLLEHLTFLQQFILLKIQ